MAAVLQRPLRGSRISTFYPVKTLPSLSSLDSAFQLQEYISLLIRLNVHDVETITSLPGKGTKDKDLESSEAEEQKTEEKDEKAKGDVAVDESCWIYEQLRRLAQDLTHPLITMLQTECSRSTCPEMKAGEWLYLCVAHGEGGAMEQCCAIDYILHTLDSATALLNSPRAFPSRLQIPQSSNRHFSSLARRLSRIFAHAYFHHREIFEQAEAESSLYARFLALTSKFELVPAEFLVIPFRGSGDEDEAGSRGRDSPPRGLDPQQQQQQQQQQAGRPAHPSHTPALWGQSLSSAGGGTFIRPKNRGDPPGLSRSSARKVRARTDTMVHSEAANVAEELARFESEEGDAFQVSSPSSGSGGFEEETGRRGEEVVDEPEEVGEREREKEKEVLSTSVVKTIEIPEAPQASASTTEAGAIEAEVTEESKSAASTTSAGGVEQEPSETSTAVSEDQPPPAPAEPEPEPPLSLDAEPEPEPEPQPEPEPELEEKPKPRAEPMIQIVIEPGTDLPPRPPASGFGSSSRVGDVDDGNGDGTTTASPLDEAGVIEDDEDGEEDEDDEEEGDEEGEEGEGEDEEEHGKAGSGTPALSLTPAPAPAPAPALTSAPDEQARSGESAGSADSLGVEDQLGQAPVSPVVESAGADADEGEGEDEDGDKGEYEYEVVEKENEKGKEEATAAVAESAVKPGPGVGTETQTETTGEVGASSIDAPAATTTTTAAVVATAPAPGSTPETATSSNKKEKDESGSESVSTDS